MGYFVYLLRSKNHKGASYIGYSVDPRHRLRKHNGEVKGGARHTSKYSPWSHVCVVSGFMNKSMALMFEWHWQHPSRSLVLKEAAKGVKHHGRGPHGKLLLLNSLLGDRMWSQCELTVNFLEDDGFKAFEKIRKHHFLSASIKMARIESDDLDIMTKSQPSFIEAATLATNTAKDLGKQVICAVCNEGVETSKDKYLWCCFKCGTAHHILCSAARAMVVIRSDDSLRNTHLPAVYSCKCCQDTVTRMAATRMTFSPQVLLVASSDVLTTTRLSEQLMSDDDCDSDDNNDDENEGCSGENAVEITGGGDFVRDGGYGTDEGFSILEDGDSYLDIDNTWSQYDALDEKDVHDAVPIENALDNDPRKQFNESYQVLVEGAEETRSSFIYSDGDTNATEGGGSSTTKPFFDLTQM